MSTFGRDERVQESGVVGHSHDSDDRIEDLDIYEALVNPHDAEGGTKKGGAGGPGMMPMGAGAGGGSGHAGAAAGSTTPGSTGPSRGTSAAGTGTGASGVAGPGFAGAGSGAGVSGLGGSGPGGLGGLSAGGLGGSGLGAGASNFSMPTLGTRAAGVSDPSTTDFEVPPYTGTAPGGDLLPSPGTNPGAGALPNVPHPGAVPGSGTPPTMPNPSTGIEAPSIPTVGGSGSGMPGIGGAGSGTGGAGGAPSSGSLAVAPVQASPEMLHKEAQHWDDTAREFTAAVVNPVNALAPSSVDFGMMVDAFASYSDLVYRMKKWSSDAGAEFVGISDALQSASGGYQDTEATNVSESRMIATGSSTVAV